MRSRIQIFFVTCFVFSTPVLAQTTPRVDLPEIQSNENFAEIKPGFFDMGSPADELDHYYDEQLHKVTLTKAFQIQKTTVTQEQYFLITGKTPSLFNKKEFCPETYKELNGLGLCPTHPVERISWNDAQAFIEKLNSLDVQYTYRLPTEAEWEYTARAHTVTMFWFGNSLENISDFSWSGRNSSGQSHAVALKPANPFGIYDAQGNVWQWTNDWYGNYSAEDQQDPTGFQNGVTKVLRGGSFNSPALDLRAAARTRMPPQAWGADISFRLVRVAK